MIRYNYIHALDDDILMQEQAEEDSLFFEKAINNIAFYSKKCEMMEMFHESADEFDLVMESVGDGLRKIGEKILSIIERVKNFIKDTFQKLKTASWERKDVDQKLAKLVKEDPALADKVKVAVRNGDLELNDFKDLATFYKTIDDVMSNLEKGDIDPKSVKGRIEKAKQTLEKHAQTIILVGSVAGGILTCKKLYDAFHKENTANGRELEQMRGLAEKQADKMEKFGKALDNIETSRTGDLSQIQSKASIMAYLTGQYEQVTYGCIRKRTQFQYNLFKTVDRAMDAMKHDVTKRTSSIDNVRSNVNRAANIAQSAINSYNDRINNRS